MAERESVKVLYIACVPHSGSTILANTLGEIDGFFSAGELYFLRRILATEQPCGCGRALDECDVWAEILTTATRNGGVPKPDPAWLTARALPRLLTQDRRGGSERLGDYRRALERLYRSLQEATDCRVVVDSSKSPTYGHILAGAPGIDFAVVHLVRDPRATAFSWRRKVNFNLNTNPLKFGLIWTFWNSVIERLWKHGPVPYLLVRYEDFVARPEETLRRIVELVDEEPAELPLRRGTTVLLGPNHTVAGNQNRFRTGEVALRPDDEWRSRVGVATALATTSVTWPIERRYGYGARRPLREKRADAS
jgi:hypothetical protein